MIKREIKYQIFAGHLQVLLKTRHFNFVPFCCLCYYRCCCCCICHCFCCCCCCYCFCCRLLLSSFVSYISSALSFAWLKDTKRWTLAWLQKLILKNVFMMRTCIKFYLNWITHSTSLTLYHSIYFTFTFTCSNFAFDNFLNN